MNFYFLDAGGAGLAYFVLGLFIGFMILCILVEAGIMLAIKYNPGFKKTLFDSLLANLASVAVGFILIEYVDIFFNSYDAWNLFALFGITVVIEGGVLYLRNKNHGVMKTLVVTLVMNIPTYIALYFIGNG